MCGPERVVHIGIGQGCQQACELRIVGFLSGIDLRRPNHVYVASAAAGVSDELAQQRAQTLNGLLRARGVAVRADPPQAAPGAGAPDGPSRTDAARLLIGYYAVATPGCPDWRKPTAIDYSNQPSSNFGCASQINLGLMVADLLLVRFPLEGLGMND